MELVTTKQNKFIEEYLVDLNGTQAAIRAGYSEKTADQQASRLLRNVNIRRTLNKRLEKLFENLRNNQQKILNELSVIAFSNITDYVEYDKEGISVKDSREIPKILLNAISEITSTQLSETTEGRLCRTSIRLCRDLDLRRALSGSIRKKITIKLHNKIEALKLLGEYHKLWKGAKDQNEEISWKIVIERVDNFRKDTLS